MTIAEKLTLIAQNEQKVYNAGYEKGKSEGGGGGEQPTLFAPSISLNSASSELTIIDNRNGDFVQGYNLYANDELVTVLTSKTAILTDYLELTETMDIKVQAKGEKFNSSEYSNVVEWFDAAMIGTIGLAYELSSDGTYATCTGIGTATDTDIVIASKYEGFPVTSIGTTAFKNNRNLTSVVIGDGVTSIGYSAFNDCRNLTSVVIGVGVTSIDRYVFNDCRNLTSIDIPSGVTSIGDGSFQLCSNLKRVDFSNHTSIPTIGSNVFSSTSSTLQIKVPANLETTWESATNWSNYADKIVTEFTNTI